MTSEGWKRLIFILVAAVYGTLIVAAAARKRGALGRTAAGVVLGWLVPGAGHAWLGRARKGLFLFVLIAGTFAAGCVLARGRTVTFDENPFYHIGQIGSGLTLGVTQWLAKDGLPPKNDSALPQSDPGLLYMSVAGLLNLLLILNLFDVALGGAPATPAPAPAPGTAPPPGKEGGAP